VNAVWVERIAGIAATATVAVLPACSGSASSPGSSGPATSSGTQIDLPGDAAPPSAVPDLGRAVATYRTFAGPLAVLAGKLYVSNGLDPQQRLQQVDTATGRLDGGVRIRSVAADQIASGRGVLWLTYVGNSGRPNGPIIAFSVDQRRVIATLRGPSSDTVAVAGDSLWALDTAHGGVNEIDQRTGRILRTIVTGRLPLSIVYAFGSVWVGNHDAGTVTRIDPVSGRILATIDIPAEPLHLAAGLGSIWVGSWSEGSLVRIDPQSNKPVSTINVTPAPDAITFADGAVWVSDSTDGDLFRVDPTTNKVVDDIGLETGHEGSYLAVAGGFVWVAMPGNATFKIDPHI
jgi:streptogramin lyase